VLDLINVAYQQPAAYANRKIGHSRASKKYNLLLFKLNYPN